jgi:ABC-type bacteriocin/lantibiotic exporter with double-glycine peptidase domain
MKVEDAPPSGWYPDPEGYTRLRWWEGTDWSDRYRAPPTPSERDLEGQTFGYLEDHPAAQIGTYDPRGGGGGGMTRQESEAMINQVRMAAREEAERAANLFGAQARAVTSGFTPLISQYTNKIIKWIRILSVIAIVLVVGWVVFQIFAQVSMFEWIGDRIDNLSDNSGMIVRSP